jgi:excisionase family DNA binding protein
MGAARLESEVAIIGFLTIISIRRKRGSKMAFAEVRESSALLTVADAAKYLGVARRTIYLLIEWDELKVVQVQGSVRVEQKSLDKFRSGGMLT